MFDPHDLDRIYHKLCDIHKAIEENNKILLLKEYRHFASTQDKLYEMYIEKFAGVKLDKTEGEYLE